MSRIRVALVDSGGANIASVRYALERVGADARLTRDPAQILAADRVILPGVGAAGAGMRRLHQAGLVEVLQQVQQPLLGVCLGMQLLFEESAEDGGTPCLGLLSGRVLPIRPAPGQRVPHMGWNTMSLLRPDPVGEVLPAGTRAYFVHSFGVPVTSDTVLSTEHSGRWSAVVRNGHRWGVQFHPERSSRAGERLLRHFVREVSP